MQKLLHAVGMPCIDYHEACQRKNRANSWNDCHSRVEASRQQAASAEKKMLGFRARASRISSFRPGRTALLRRAAERPIKKAAVIAYLAPLSAHLALGSDGLARRAPRAVRRGAWGVGSGGPGPGALRAWTSRFARPPIAHHRGSRLVVVLVLGVSARARTSAIGFPNPNQYQFVY
jgi:hypothetical protein